MTRIRIIAAATLLLLPAACAGNNGRPDYGKSILLGTIVGAAGGAGLAGIQDMRRPQQSQNRGYGSGYGGYSPYGGGYNTGVGQGLSSVFSNLTRGL